MLKVSAPGSMLLFGEHSVLRGKHAIVLAINKRIYIELQPRSDRLLCLTSELGQYQTTLDEITIQQPFQFLLQALQSFPPATGLNINISSEMLATIGFGTSAAVVVALLGGLMTLAQNYDQDLLFTRVLEVVRQVQGKASGADVIASVKGGIGLYRADPKLYHSLSLGVELFAAYSGAKMPTAEVIKLVEARFLNHKQLQLALDNANDALTLEALNYLADANELGMLIDSSSGLMEALGVHTQELAHFLWTLRQQAHGAKLSGSGLGDCAIGVVKNSEYPKGSFPVEISPKGFKVEMG